MKKTILAIMISTAVLIAGCSGGGTFDLTQTPEKVKEKEGLASAVSWCDKRDDDVIASGGLRTVVGGLFDVTSFLTTIPVAFALGKTVVEGTTSTRDAQCEKLRESGAD